ncbi:hypothetical protein BGZ76_005409 [Entomortierella beljakovae]|nr:hypothetical protein BGZ76_005409 [Entomortierella beljakovae]
MGGGNNKLSDASSRSLKKNTYSKRATGQFTYKYIGIGAEPRVESLSDPPSKECITLPEVKDQDSQPAHSPSNGCDSKATVFTGVECDGDHFTLRPNGGHASDRLKFRSVIFE